MQKVLTNRTLRIPLKIRLLHCYVFSILFYGMEAWTLTEAMCKRIEAFQTWTYRRMLKTSWMDRVTNQAVVQRMSKQREVLNTIKRRKLEYFAHVMRNPKYELLHIIIQGKHGPNRRRTSRLKNLGQWYGVNTTKWRSCKWSPMFWEDTALEEEAALTPSCHMHSFCVIFVFNLNVTVTRFTTSVSINKYRYFAHASIK